MRPGLLLADADLDLGALPLPDATLVADLGFERLFATMAGGDRGIDDVVRRVLAAPLTSAGAIRYRQASVTDALANPAVVRELYALVTEAVDAERKVWGGQMRNAELVLDRAAEVIGLFLATFRSMRRIEADHAAAFTSPGFASFFELVRTQLDDAWLAEADDHVKRLRTRTLTSARTLDPATAAPAMCSIDGPTPCARGAVGWASRSAGPRWRSCSATRTR